jgi:hypothetical protein
MPPAARVLALAAAAAAACVACLVAPAAAAGLPPGAGASEERPAHPAAHAFDGNTATYWQSKTPAAGQFLTYTFPSPQTVLQYSLRRAPPAHVPRRCP